MFGRYFECVIPSENKNKFYNVHLKRTDTGIFYVFCGYGRKGKTFITQDKFFGTDFNSALTYFNKIAKTRLAHGYKEIHFIPVADIPYNQETDEHYKERCREIEAGLNNPLLTGGTKLTQNDVDAIRRAGL
ncbi:MAG: WGR domain-containing protein [Elusimicrobiota bacterium]